MEKEKKFDLACLGILVLDVFGKSIDTFPAKGTSGYFDTLEIHPGGCAYNTGVDAARLGLEVAILGKTGTDQFGNILITALEKENADVQGVCRSDDSNTAFSFVMVPEDGQRRLYHTFGVNRNYCKSEVDAAVIADSKVFHIAGAGLLPALDGKPTVELLKYAQAHGVLTSMDPVVKEDIADVIIPCLPHLDLFLPNNDESVFITGCKEPEDQLKFYLDRGVRIAGIKMGEKGVLISDGKESFRQEIYRVPVVDTCGAGDAFVAGFIYGLIKELNLAETVKFATAVAAFCVQAIGTTTAVPQAEIVKKFIKQEGKPCR
jgi:sugar/nucleoside kinase (ribokinase family)